MDSAVFAGSFDPFTTGHLEIVQRALPLFSSLTILVAHNPVKTGFLPLELRLEVARLSVQGLPGVRVESWEGLTVDYMQTHGIRVLVRGLRNHMDLVAEQALEWANRRLFPNCETVYLQSSSEFQQVSSTLVRELLRHKADITGLVAPRAADILRSQCLG